MLVRAMYFTSELGPNSAVYPEPRIFFTMEYVDADRSFARAAETWRRIVPQAARFNPAQDEVLNWVVPTEGEFRRVWALVAEACRIRKAKPFFGAVFSHASKNGAANGLEFRPAPGDDGTLSHGEISGLEVLPWHEDGALVLTGCNSGATGTRGWSPAAAFATRQGVRTLGQTGYAYFSRRWTQYEEIRSTDRDLCLWAFRRRRNGMFGDGARMPGRVCT